MKKLLMVVFIAVIIVLMISCGPNPEKEYINVKTKIDELGKTEIKTNEDRVKVNEEVKKLLSDYIQKFPDFEKTGEFKKQLAEIEYLEVEEKLNELKSREITTEEQFKLIVEEAKTLLTDYINKHPEYENTQNYRAELKDIYFYTGDYENALTILDDMIKYNKNKEFAEELVLERIFILDQKLKAAYTPELEKDLIQKIEDFKKDFPESKYKDLIEGVKRTIVLRVGQPILEFKALDTKKKEFSFEQYKGKVLLLDFWASWCGPCKEEMPNVLEIYKEYKPKGFEIVGVSLDADLDKMEEYIKENKIEWRQIADGKYWDSEFGKFYNIRSIPATFLIDRKGIIRYINVRGEALENAVKTLVEEK